MTTNAVIGSFEIIGIRSGGDLEKERLLLRAIEPIKLNSYIVVNSFVIGDKLGILNDKVFWFPNIDVLAGEFVRLYSKKGTYSKQDSTSAGKPAIYHNFFWQSDVALWNNITCNAFTILKSNLWSTAYSVDRIPETGTPSQNI